MDKYDDDADWPPAALDDGHSEYDLPECDAVEDGGTGYATADVWKRTSATTTMVPVTRAAACEREPVSGRMRPHATR